MLTLAPATRVYLAPGATDMRKSFTGLAAVTEGVIGEDPTSGHLFAFCNRRRNLLKILFWDGTGFWLLAKRLERGTFAWPAVADEHLTLSGEELSWILGGLDLQQAARRRWWKRQPLAAAS